MFASNPTVFVVDDDKQARDSVCALVRSMGVSAESFSSAEAFLEAYRDDRPGCLVTDVRMLGMSGAELQQKLIDDEIPLPVIVVTAYAKTSLTVEVVQKGAVNVLEKPYDENELGDSISKALELDEANRAARHERRDMQQRLDSLTEKERDVLDRVVAGKANKVIARELDISIRTVENRRHAIFEKMQAHSVAELVQMVISATGPRQ